MTKTLALSVAKTVADEALHRAGGYLLSRFGKSSISHYKTATHPTVAEDLKSEQLITQHIKAHFPQHQIIGEEQGTLSGNSYQWYIDPLDGTRNFAAGFPVFVTQLALVLNGQILYSAIFAPLTNEYFWAMSGKGAHVNGRRISVSQTTELSQYFVTFGAGGHLDHLNWLNRSVHGLAPQINAFRFFGSTGYELALVARGALDAHISRGGQPYDYLPGTLLVQEAGGRISQLDGSPFKVDSNELLASNQSHHGQLLSYAV